MPKRILALLIAATALFSACGDSDAESTTPEKAEASYPLTLDSGNHKTTITKQPTRIVSLSPTATEDLFAIGADKQVVAVDDQSTYPANAPKTTLSGYQPNAEAIIGYKPDLVVIANDANGLIASLDAAKIPVLVQPSASNLNDVYKEIADLGSATNNLPAAATVSTNIKARITKIVADTPQPANPLTYYHEVDNTYYSSTSSTFIGSVYSLFNLKNIADAAASGGNNYPQLSSEYIVKANPDFMFLADTKCCQQNATTVGARPGWTNLKAVSTGAVVGLDDDVASRWGPRVVDLAQTISTAVNAHAK